MLRLSLWRLGGAVTRATAAAAAPVKQRRGATPRRTASAPRRAASPSSTKVLKRAKTPMSARGRSRSAGRNGASSPSAGRGRGRASSTRSASRGRGRGGGGGAKKTKSPAPRAAPPARASAEEVSHVGSEGDEAGASASTRSASTRPAGMSAEREKQVLDAASRMQGKDITAEMPVAAFAYEILKAHPSVRSMGLRERMDFLLHRWNRLSKAQKLEYVNDPLRGLL